MNSKLLVLLCVSVFASNKNDGPSSSKSGASSSSKSSTKEGPPYVYKFTSDKPINFVPTKVMKLTIEEKHFKIDKDGNKKLYQTQKTEYK
ncbi:hypothetical protein AAJ76_1100069970 [Vairimorpha ceranae]|uniref:Uncharacterized protein n=1 Tax=Vairimorpha ceranae TaxID=40302 RepID=A0A0F9YTM0_9MICR|nr:hypothetical protein AAJ76_1100069970 [Vairimorpha ceranae]KAF5140354.1 hypothetical protein G9O61_00g014620 [Vairimorpha ceranae]KKO75842.1 hypothetical protein AAJ76_1100069970 [Vairimorpha ceranae]